MPPKNLKHFFCLGIGGSGMSPLAELAVAAGHTVRGYDVKESKTLSHLRSRGVVCFSDQQAATPEDQEIIVYSSAIKESDQMLSAAKKRRLTVWHRSDWLAYLMEGSQSICVAGTHGKTTTTAMIAHILIELGLDPSLALGGTLLSLASSARHGKSNLFVAEADESDGSFLKYHPFIGLVTNIDADHLDHFKDQAAIDQAFLTFLNQVDEDGRAVIGWDDKRTRSVGLASEAPRLAYGFNIGCDIRGMNYRVENGRSAFTAIVERDSLECTLPMFGRHNVLNALGALAVCRGLDLDMKKAAAALATFPGVARRMQRLKASLALHVYDDYAHNPGKIAAAVSAMREAFPDRHLFVVFEPHRYSRLETLYYGFTSAFVQADDVLVTPVFAAGEVAPRAFDMKRLAEDISTQSAVHAAAYPDFASVVQYVKSHLTKPAVVLTVGAGDCSQIAEKLAQS